MSESNTPRDQDPSQTVDSDAEANTRFLRELIENADPRPTADEFLGMVAAQSEGTLLRDTGDKAGQPVDTNVLKGIKVELSGREGTGAGMYVTSAAGIREYFNSHREDMSAESVPEVSPDGAHVRLHNRDQLRGFLMAHEKRGFGELSTVDVADRVQDMIDEVNGLHGSGELALKAAGAQNLFDLPPELSQTVADIFLDERHTSSDGKVEDFIDRTKDNDDATLEGGPDLDALKAYAAQVRAEQDDIPVEGAQSVGEVIARQVAAVTEAVTSEASLAPEATAVERLIAQQVADLESGENLQRVTGLLSEADQPTEYEGAAVEAEVAETATEYMSYEDLVDKHLEDIITGQSQIEGADPEMVGGLTRQVRLIEREFVNARMESSLAGVGTELRTAVSELLQNGNVISDVEARARQLGYELEEFTSVSRQLMNVVEYGQMDDIPRYVGMFKQAAEALGLDGGTGSTNALHVLSGAAFEDSRALMLRVNQAVEDAETKIRREKGEASNYDTADIQAELVSIFNEGGRTIEGLRDGVDQVYPNRSTTRAELANVDELATHMRIMSNIVHLETTGGYHNQDVETAYKSLRNETVSLLENMQRNGVRGIGVPELAHLAHQAEQIRAIVDSVQRFTARTKAMASTQTNR